MDMYTRSSATAKGPRDALCQLKSCLVLKSCQLLHSIAVRTNSLSSDRWQTLATRCITTNGKILKQSRDHNHAPIVGDMLSCC